MGIIDGEISTIRNEVYGEEIRTAIYTAFEKLSNGIPSSDEIYEIIEEAIGSGDVLKFKGELADNNVFDLNTIKYHGKNPGVFTVWQHNSYYSHMPIDSDNGYYVLVDLSTDDTFVVQMLFPVDLTADGTFWVRTKISTNSNESYGWYRIGSGGVSALTVKGNLETVANLNTMSAVEDQGIYRIVSSWSYSGLPSGFGGSDAILKNYIFTLSSSSSTVAYRIQELSYIDGSKSWIRGKSGTATFATSDWNEVAGSGSGGTVNPQDIEDAVFDYLEHDADLNQIIADYIGDQGSVDEASVKGWIEGYVDKNNTSNAAGKAKFNASVNALIQAALSGYSTTDRTYSSDVNQAVTGFLTANSDLSDANKEYITNARNEYTTYNDTVKPSVADGVVGLAAFRMAIQAIKPARSGGEVENSIRSLYATTRDATKPIGWATDWANAYDLAGLMPLYNTYYASGDARSELNPLTKAAVADGMLGFAAFKRTEWYPTPQMYGAKADGVTDDLGAIKRAINANRGKTVYFPAGTYMISNTLFIKGTDEEYTDIIMDPSACIKATQYWGGYQQDGTTPVAQQGGFMIMIGERTPHDIVYNKARKKIFMGGVLDSNTRAAYGTYGYIAGIMQVNPDVTDFDLSETVFMATNTATGFALGDNTWYTAKGELSTDAYIHHITLRKYSWNDAADPKVGTTSEKNRASGISVHTSDNNFENIRVYYFKRNVKITHGSGNYFSDVHTLGTAFNVYNKDSSGFFLENKTRITLDQCYVDADNHFLYVADEAAGSEIYVSQCMHYQYGGSGGANRTMTAFYLGSANYTDSSKLGYNLVSRLDVNQFTMIPNSKTGEETNDIGRHQGIAVSSSTNDGSYFAMQTHKHNLSLNRINILAPHKLKRGDILRGAIGGERGSVLLLRTTLARLNDNSLCSKWHEVCSIPVSNGPNGKISYRISIIFDGYYLTFPLAIYKNKTVTDNNHLAISIGSQKIETDDEREYEIGFTYENGPTTPYAYTMWIRMINAKYSTNSFYSRAIEEVIFDSKTSITPSACQTGRDGFTVLNSTTSTPSFVKFNTDKTIIFINCKTPSIKYLSAPSTQ